MFDKNRGFYLGYGVDQTEGKKPRLYDEVRYDGDRHLMVLGPNGSGKTRRVLLPNVAMLKDWSMVVVDPKGVLAKMAAEFRDPGLKNSIFLNPFGVMGLPSHGYNPLAALDPTSEDFPDDAMILAESMIRVSGHEPHWSESAQDLIAALIMYSVFLRRPNPKDTTLGNLPCVRELLGKSTTEFALMADVMRAVGNKDNQCPELAAKAARFVDMTEESRELISIISTALTQTRWLDSRPIKKDLARDTQIDFKRLRSEPTTIYLILPANRMGTHSTWVRVMLASILQPLLKDATRGNTPVLLMLDEYPALAQGGFPVIEKNMAMFREYGIKLLTVWQDLAQAKRLYGEGWESFSANAGALQSFAPQDVLTAKHLSEMTGLRATLVPSEGSSTSRKGSEQPSEGESRNMAVQGIPLMLPQHLRRMDDGYAVMFGHRWKGTMRSYFPPHLQELWPVYAKDPSGTP